MNEAATRAEAQAVIAGNAMKGNLDVPVITTDRLVLRAPSAGDLDAIAAFGASDRSRFVGGPFGRFDAWAKLLSGIGHWVLRGYGYWSVDERRSGRMAGRVGVSLHEGWPEPELGWHIYDGFEGQGLAREAALAVRAHAAAHFGLDRIISLIDPANTRSAALAARLGAVIEGRMTLLGHEADVWRHPAAGTLR